MARIRIKVVLTIAALGIIAVTFASFKTVNSNPVIHFNVDISSPDSSNVRSMQSTWYDGSNDEMKSVKIIMKNNEIVKLVVDGKVIPKSHYSEYVDEIERAMRLETHQNYLTDADLEEIERDIDEAMDEIDHIDLDQIVRDFSRAMEDAGDHFREYEYPINEFLSDITFPEIEELMEGIGKAIEISVDGIDMGIEAIEDFPPFFPDINIDIDSENHSLSEPSTESSDLEKKLEELEKE